MICCKVNQQPLRGRVRRSIVMFLVVYPGSLPVPNTYYYNFLAPTYHCLLRESPVDEAMETAEDRGENLFALRYKNTRSGHDLWSVRAHVLSLRADIT